MSISTIPARTGREAGGGVRERTPVDLYDVVLDVYRRVGRWWTHVNASQPKDGCGRDRTTQLLVLRAIATGKRSRLRAVYTSLEVVWSSSGRHGGLQRYIAGRRREKGVA